MPAKKLYIISEQLNETVIFTLDKESYSYIKSEQFSDIERQINTYINAYKAKVPEAKNFKFIIQYPGGFLTDEQGKNAKLLPARLICQFTVAEENGKLSQEIVVPANTWQTRLALNTFYAYDIGLKKVTGEGASSAIKEYEKEKAKLDAPRKKIGWLLLFLGIALFVAIMVSIPLVTTPALIIPLVLSGFLAPILMVASGHFLLRSSEEVYRNAYFDLPSFDSPSADKPTYLPEPTTNLKSLGSELPAPSQPEASQADTNDKLSKAPETSSNIKPGGSSRT